MTTLACDAATTDSLRPYAGTSRLRLARRPKTVPGTVSAIRVLFFIAAHETVPGTVFTALLGGGELLQTRDGESSRVTSPNIFSISASSRLFARLAQNGPFDTPDMHKMNRRQVDS
jgi:hypothetical protein